MSHGNGDIRPPEDVHIPACLYSCARDECREERSYPAEDLFWIPQYGGWYCYMCLDCTLDECEVGVSLAQWLREHDEPVG